MKSLLVSLSLLMFAGSACFAVGPKKKAESNATSSTKQAEINKKVLERRTPEAPVQIYIFLDEQELDLVVGDKVAIVSPTSTGKRAGWTPLGQFEIIAKSANHRSSTYGKHVSRSGKVTRSDVDSRKTKPAAGSRFVGAPMPNFLRLTQNGIGIHAGKLPGYPASHGCIRVPLEVSSLLFEHCGVGTKVNILQNRGAVIN